MQNRMIAGLTLSALCLVAAQAAEAQDGPRPRVRIERREGPGRVEVQMTRRARLGVMVNLAENDEDKYGATIDGVTPGGPADKAGLRAGDVITAIDGKSLTSGETPADADEDSSIPGLRLIALAAKLGAEDTITVAYRRGGDAKTTKLVTSGNDGDVMYFATPDGGGGEMRNFTFRRGPGAPPMPPLPPEMRDLMPSMIDGIDIRNENGMRRIMINTRGGLGDLELAPLNADLGRYFGTSEGVLVLNTPKAVGLGLKGGDVVQAIDGRKVTSPAQLQRILRTYEPGETMKFELQRDRRSTTVTGKVPERQRMEWRPDGDGKVEIERVQKRKGSDEEE